MKRPSFTLLELIVVIILIAILSFSINISIPNDKLQLASDTLNRYVHYTNSLALKNDKYLPIPNNSSEEDKSKYWFRRFYQLKIAVKNNYYYAAVYSDEDLDNYIDVNEIAKDPLTNKYIDGSHYFPTADKDSNLSTFGITHIKYKYKNISSDVVSGKPLRIYFSNNGEVFICQNGVLSCSSSEINMYKNLNLVTSNIEINLTKNSQSKIIVITPTGYSYIK